MLQHGLEQARGVPLAHDFLHVGVGCEERDDPVGHDARALEQERAVVANRRLIGPGVEFGGEERLICAARDDERSDDVARKGHLERLDHHGLDGENLLVHVEG